MEPRRVSARHNQSVTATGQGCIPADLTLNSPMNKEGKARHEVMQDLCGKGKKCCTQCWELGNVGQGQMMEELKVRLGRLMINIPRQSGAFVTTDEPTLTYQHHPESVGFIQVRSWCCTVCGFGQMYIMTNRLITLLVNLLCWTDFKETTPIILDFLTSGLCILVSASAPRLMMSLLCLCNIKLHLSSRLPLETFSVADAEEVDGHAGRPCELRMAQKSRWLLGDNQQDGGLSNQQPLGNRILQWPAWAWEWILPQSVLRMRAQPSPAPLRKPRQRLPRGFICAWTPDLQKLWDQACTLRSG